MRCCSLLLAVSAALSCSYDSPYARKSAYQQRQATRLRAAKLPRSDNSEWGAIVPQRLRVYATARYRRADSAFRSRVESQLAHANEVLRDTLKIRLDLEEILPWELDPNLEQDARAALDALSEHDDGRDADWVIGLLGSLPRASQDFGELGAAHMLGKHLVLRDMFSLQERDAIMEGFDTLDDETRRRLLRERQEHKETVCLLHELAHTLGALHVDHPATVMHPAYDNRMRTFAEPNMVIMRRVLEFRRQPEDTRDAEELIDWLSQYLEGLSWEHWVAAERADYSARLREALGDVRAQRQAAAQLAEASKPEHDVSALAEDDRERFAAARAAGDAGEWEAAWEGATQLAERYPDSYAAQHLACALAMQTGARLKTIRAYCGRMQELAAEDHAESAETPVGSTQ